MQIITLTCPDCGTIVAGNVLEEQREIKCPRTDCNHVLRFADLTRAEREQILNNRDKYKID